MKVVVVTGANKGVGYGTVRQLLLQTKSPLLIYMTSRDEARGQEALTKIQSESDIKPKLQNNQVKWHQLDIMDEQSVKSIKDFIVQNHGTLDVLINNAGIATKGDTFNRDVVDTTIACNYTATLRMCETFLPIMTSGGRLVNVSSMAGKLHRLDPSLQKRFRDPKLTVDDATALLKEFSVGVQDSSPPQGWPKAGYAVSKMGVTAMTKALARQYPAEKVQINAVCPGHVRTDMAGQKAPKSIDEGGLTPTFAAIGDIGATTTGEFFENCAVSQW